MLKWLHKNTPIFFFLAHADMTAVTTQSNTIVSNDVKDNEVLLGPPYAKKYNGLFGQPSTCIIRLIHKYCIF